MSPSSMGRTALLKLAFRGKWAAPCSSSSSISSGLTARCSRKQNETLRPRPTAVAASYLHRLLLQAGRDNGRHVTHTNAHPLGWGEASLESITAWVLQLGALQSLLSHTQKLLVEFLRGDAVSLTSSCYTNNWVSPANKVKKSDLMAGGRSR